MKYLVAVAIMSLALYGLTSAGARAGDGPAQVIGHHNSSHSQGPCGPVPCPPKPNGR
jgi:hypothetical protein